MLRVLLLAVLLVLGGCRPAAAPLPSAHLEPPAEPLPPLTPRWAFEPWAWEDETNTARALRELVDGYSANGIPLGAVIIDSPWSTNYNSFEFGPNYPAADDLISELHARGIRTLLWMTGFINVSSADGPERGKAALYDEAFRAGYFVEGGRVYQWWKGRGSAIDFFNPDAVGWWYRQMDRAFGLGIDGWKVDNAERNLPDEVETAAGKKSLREYRDAYYRAIYQYTVGRKPDAIIAARPYAFESTDLDSVDGNRVDPLDLLAARRNDGGVVYAPVDATSAGWVGDQTPDWAGLDEALDNILASAERSYAVVGSDIGGYLAGRRDPRLFIRWAQLGALSPLMENGGRGEHRPWRLGGNVLNIYRTYAKLHHELVPYLYSAGVQAHLTGQPIIRSPDRVGRQYLLGEDLLVAPILGPEDEREVNLPPGRWHDFWDDARVLEGPSLVRYAGPLERMPLFIRAGAIVPLQVDDGETGHGGSGSAGRLTLLVYPEGESARSYHPDGEHTVLLSSHRGPEGVSVELGPSTERYALRIKEPSRPPEVRLQQGTAEALLAELPDWAAYEAAEAGWYYDPSRRQLWARFGTQEAAARLSYSAP